MSGDHNELLRSPHVFLMAVENGRILARVLTGVCASRGYFALFDAADRADAVNLLMDAAEEWQRKQGSTGMVGPIAPTLLDLGGGVLQSGFEQQAAFCDIYNASYYGEFLEKCGFSIESEWLAYRVNLARFDRDRYRRIAEWSSRRFDYHLARHMARHPRELADVLWRIMDGETDREAICRLIGQIYPFLKASLCPVVCAGEEPVGILLTLCEQGNRPRIATMWVKKAWRRKGVTAVMFDALVQEADRMGCAEIDGSMVRADNLPSRMSIESLSGQVVHRYCRYGKQV